MSTDILFRSFDNVDWRRAARGAIFRGFVWQTLVAAEGVHGRGRVRISTRTTCARWIVKVIPEGGEEHVVAEVDRESLDVFHHRRPVGPALRNASESVFVAVSTAALRSVVAMSPGSLDCAQALFELARRGEDVDAFARQVADDFPDRPPSAQDDRVAATFHVQPVDGRGVANDERKPV